MKHETLQTSSSTFDVRLGAGLMPGIKGCPACLGRVVELAPSEASVDCPACGAPVTTIERTAPPEAWEVGLEAHQKLSVARIGCYPQHLRHSDSECEGSGVVQFVYPGQPDPVCPSCGDLMLSFRVVDADRFGSHLQEAKAQHVCCEPSGVHARLALPTEGNRPTAPRREDVERPAGSNGAFR